MVMTKHWGELNPPEFAGVDYKVEQKRTTMKSGIVVVSEEIIVSYRPTVPIETIELTIEVIKEMADERRCSE
jgi:hypothetical protein